MVQPLSEPQPSAGENEPLQPSLEPLGWALAAEFPGREADWAAHVSRALDRLEKGLRQHIAGAEAPDGLLTEVDLTRPTLVRRVSDLRREHSEFLDRVIALRRRVQGAAQAFQSQAGAGQPTTLPSPAGPDAVADFGAIRRCGEQLVADLLHHKEAETDVTLESVSTDIGVGD
jgi:hypothetical protein